MQNLHLFHFGDDDRDTFFFLGNDRDNIVWGKVRCCQLYFS